MKKSNMKQSISLLLYCSPALLFFSLFLFIPMFGGFFYSFTNWNALFKDYQIVGLANYVEALTVDGRFYKSLVFTSQLVVVIVILQNIMGLSVALLVESMSRTKAFFRTIFFMPNILSIYISSLMWAFIFARVLPQLADLLNMYFLDQPWTSDPRFSFWSIVLVTLWQGVGYLMIIYIAAIQGVPRDIVESSMIDGATGFQRFIHIIFPLLMPAVTVCLFLTLNSSFKIFDVVYSLTKGGPGYETEVLALNIYNEGFTGDLRFGYATAKSFILFLIVLIITLIQVSITKKREVEL